MTVAVKAGASFEANGPVALFQTHRRQPVSAQDFFPLGGEWRGTAIPDCREVRRSQCCTSFCSNELGR
jgi:hypothetical protein